MLECLQYIIYRHVNRKIKVPGLAFSLASWFWLWQLLCNLPLLKLVRSFCSYIFLKRSNPFKVADLNLALTDFGNFSYIVKFLSTFFIFPDKDIVPTLYPFPQSDSPWFHGTLMGVRFQLHCQYLHSFLLLKMYQIKEWWNISAFRQTSSLTPFWQAFSPLTQLNFSC